MHKFGSKLEKSGSVLGVLATNTTKHYEIYHLYRTSKAYCKSHPEKNLVVQSLETTRRKIKKKKEYLSLTYCISINDRVIFSLSSIIRDPSNRHFEHSHKNLLPRYLGIIYIYIYILVSTGHLKNNKIKMDKKYEKRGNLQKQVHFFTKKS